MYKCIEYKNTKNNKKIWQLLYTLPVSIAALPSFFSQTRFSPSNDLMGFGGEMMVGGKCRRGLGEWRDYLRYWKLLLMMACTSVAPRVL